MGRTADHTGRTHAAVPPTFTPAFTRTRRLRAARPAARDDGDGAREQDADRRRRRCEGGHTHRQAGAEGARARRARDPGRLQQGTGDLPLRPRHHAALLRRALVRLLRLLHRAQRGRADRPWRSRPRLRAVDPCVGAGQRQVDTAPPARRADHVPGARGGGRGGVPVEPHADEHRGQLLERRAPRLAPLARRHGLRAPRGRQPVQPHAAEAAVERHPARHAQGAHLRIPADHHRARPVDRLHEPRQLRQFRSGFQRDRCNS